MSLFISLSSYLPLLVAGSPLEPYFMAVFTLCAALAAIAALPALFPG